MKVTDFYNEVARRADTSSTKINVAETKRVLAVGFEVLNELSAAEFSDVVAKGLAAAAKKKAAKKKKK